MPKKMEKVKDKHLEETSSKKSAEKESEEKGIKEEYKKPLEKYKTKGFAEVLQHIGTWEKKDPNSGERTDDRRMKKEDKEYEATEEQARKARLIELAKSILKGEDPQNIKEKMKETFHLLKDSIKDFILKKIKSFFAFIGQARRAIRKIRDLKKSTTSEKESTFLGAAKKLLEMAGEINEGLGEVDGVKYVPVVGQILSIIKHSVGLADNVMGFYKAHKARAYMKTQRQAALEQIRENQGDMTNGALVKTGEEMGKKPSKKEKKKAKKASKDNQDKPAVKYYLDMNHPDLRPQWLKETEGRTATLEEVTAETWRDLRHKRKALKESGEYDEEQQHLFHQNNRLRKGLEDYAVTDALAAVNKDRMWDHGVDALEEDLAGIATSALTLSGVGAPIAGAIEGFKMMKKAAAKIVNGITKTGREWGVPYFDRNKTEIMEATSHHYTAVFNYKFFRRMAKNEDIQKIRNVSADTTNEEDIQNVNTYMPNLKAGMERVSAMGITSARLSRAKSAAQMISMMRAGFYSTPEEVLSMEDF